MRSDCSRKTLAAKNVLNRNIILMGYCSNFLNGFSFEHSFISLLNKEIVIASERFGEREKSLNHPLHFSMSRHDELDKAICLLAVVIR